MTELYTSTISLMKTTEKLNLEFNIIQGNIDDISSFLLSCPSSFIQYNCNTPLRLSVKIGNLDIVKLLIQHGANMYDHNEQFKEYNPSMLSQSIISNQQSIFDYLVPFYDINQELAFNSFLKSIELKHNYYIEQFISHKINVTQLNDLALNIAFSHDNIETALLLIAEGADITNVKLNNSISTQTKMWIKKYRKNIDLKNKLDQHLPIKDNNKRLKL